jgi:hypothetical protein
MEGKGKGRRLHVPSPAMIVACVALFVALGGTSYAAVMLPAGSVGTKQLKKNAVTGAKVKNGSLTGADIAVSTLGKVPSAANADAATSAGHATSADTATSAGHATSADTATSAGHATEADHAADAGTLGGIGPSVFGTTMRFAGSDFRAVYSDTTYSYVLYGGLQWGGTGHTWFACPVHLPQGAKVTQVRLFWYNSGAVGTGGMSYLYGCDFVGGGPFISNQTVTSGTAAGNGNAAVALSPAWIIDNTKYAYELWWEVSSVNNVLRGAQLTYTLP